MVSLVALCTIALSLLVSGTVADPSGKNDKIASSYWGGFNPTLLPLDKVSWKKYTHMVFAFAETTPSVDELSITGGEDLLHQFVTAAKQNNVKALLSIGGWTGSRFFSMAVGSAANRTAFVNTLTSLAKEHYLDGIDFDWEYPNRQGIGCNAISKQDTPNLLSFFQELRADPIGKGLILTAAVPLGVWPDPDGNPSDISPFAKLLDYFTIMNYDIYGSFSMSVGPNSPLNDTCAPAQNQKGSAMSGITAWTTAGLPLGQILLGVPAYAHSFKVNKSVALTTQGGIAPYPPFETPEPKGDSTDGEGVDVCGVQEGYGGTFNFLALIKEGNFLNEKGKPLEGIYYQFDDCSRTPYIYNASSEIMVSYDDAKSFGLKGKFIKDTGLKGYSMWQAGGDYHDILIDAIRRGGGYYQ